MKVLDLFSGIGGFSLGLEAAGMETVAFCEFDNHARSILKKHWPETVIHEDVSKLDATEYRGTVDVVCGGFPCQDLSQAGRQAGFEGDRSSLYREMLRIIDECRPRYAIFENVAGLLTGESGRWFAQFLYDLAEIGLDAEWHCIPAGRIGAPHQRERVWVIAYPKVEHDWRGHQGAVQRQEPKPGSDPGETKVVANANVQRCKGVAKIAHHLHQQIQLVRSAAIDTGRFDLSEPPLCGANDGIPNRSHRLRRLGNAVVPLIPEAIGRAIMAVEAA